MSSTARGSEPSGSPTGSVNLLYDNNPKLVELMYQLEENIGRIIMIDGQKVQIRAHEDKLAPVVKRLRAKLEARKAKEKTEL